jgi:hypothetical protein
MCFTVMFSANNPTVSHKLLICNTDGAQRRAPECRGQNVWFFHYASLVCEEN